MKTIASQIVIYLIFLITSPCLCAPLAQENNKDTLSISLVQQVEVKKIGGKEVVCESYKVKDGDYIWKLLRQRGLNKKPDFVEVLSLLKSINTSLRDIDLIYPGQTILIPLTITPIRGGTEKHVQKSIMGISSMKDVDFDKYVVKSGDNLTTIVYGKYKIPSKYLYNEYLNLVRKFNPTLKNLDIIYPNQVIKLPIFSPEIVRMPIKDAQEKGVSKESGETISLRQKLKNIFNQMGEEWIDVGDRYIPLKAGGQIHLKAESYPVLHFESGIQLIIDLKNTLSEDISRAILVDWENYRIVHLVKDDTLATAMDKILTAGQYHKVLRPGEQVTIRSEDVDISLAGDWVILPHKREKNIPEKMTVINLINNASEQTSEMISEYLEKLGVKIIDYSDLPKRKDMREHVSHEQRIHIEKNIPFPLPSLLLTLAGQSFFSSVKIPVYQKEGQEHNFIIRADLFLNRQGKDCIIDTTGLSATAESLLKKHQFLVLSLADEKDLTRMTELILGFLGLSHDSGPHHFLAAERDEARNIIITVSGVTFYDQEGKHILATDKELPAEIVSFLNKKGYTLLELTQFENQ